MMIIIYRNRIYKPNINNKLPHYPPLQQKNYTITTVFQLKINILELNAILKNKKGRQILNLNIILPALN